MKKKPLFIFLLFIIGWNLLFFPIFYISARFRAYKILNPYIQETKNSIIINEKFGKVENVKINNILKYSTKKINHTCIEMKVIANNKKHDICTIAENKVQGYIINNRIYEEITSESYFEVNNNNNDFKKDLKKYLNKEIKFPETREPIIYNVIDMYICT